MLLSASGVLLSSQLIITVADGPPNLDFRANCRQAVVVTTAPMKTCLSEERNARKALAESWARFTIQEQIKCTAETILNGAPSYVELLTCLDFAAEARNFRRTSSGKRTAINND